MYKLAVRRDFIAQHFLIGGDWGPENDLHSHHYHVEIILEGPSLNKHGYLLDIVDLENLLEQIIADYRDCIINELPEFDGLNPSLEHFTRRFGDKFRGQFNEENVTHATIKMWEDDIAWAAHQVDLG